MGRCSPLGFYGAGSKGYEMTFDRVEVKQENKP